MGNLTYLLTSAEHEGTLWHLLRSDCMRLVLEHWTYEYDLTKEFEPALQPVRFTLQADAERFVLLRKAGVPLDQIDRALLAPSGVTSPTWASL